MTVRLYFWSLLLSMTLISWITISANAQEKKGTLLAQPETETMGNQRKELMHKLEEQMNALYASIYKGVEISNPSMELSGHVAMMAALADKIPELFPNGMKIEGSRAQPEIWKNRAQFEQAAEQLKAKLERFQVALEQQDKKELAKVYEEIDISATCNACHTIFRKEDKKAKPKP